MHLPTHTHTHDAHIDRRLLDFYLIHYFIFSEEKIEFEDPYSFNHSSAGRESILCVFVLAQP